MDDKKTSYDQLVKGKKKVYPIYGHKCKGIERGAPNFK